MYKLTIHDKSDLTSVHASCSCGEFEFRGDWDDLCGAWFQHEKDPTYNYLYVSKIDHEAHSLLTRAAAKKVGEIIKSRSSAD